METISQPSDKARRVIKRYSNRKLYDTKDSRYVTLQQIGEMVRAGEEVQIIDNATKEDKTEATLALIISEDLKSRPRSVPLGTLRDLIQERGERLLTQLREGPIGRLIPGPPTDGTAPAPAEAPPAPPPAPTPPPPAAAAVDEKTSGAKARITEIVESSKQSFQSVDERIRAILPGVGSFRELQNEVKRLAQKVEQLEIALRTGDAVPPKPDAGKKE